MMNTRASPKERRIRRAGCPGSVASKLERKRVTGASTRPHCWTRAVIGPFVSAAGDVIPASAVSIRFVDNLAEFNREANTMRRLPMYLREARPLDVRAGECARFWFDVRVPEDAAPGVYETEAAVWSGKKRGAVPVTLRVHPFALREAPQLRAMFFCMFGNSP